MKMAHRELDVSPPESIWKKMAGHNRRLGVCDAKHERSR